jgi:lysophospholipase L1-like esterase
MIMNRLRNYKRWNPTNDNSVNNLADHSKTLSLRKGIIAGVSLSLLIAISVFAAARNANAQTPDMVAAPAATSNASAAAPATGPAHTDAYVGLGDSVAAGQGLPTWTTATAQDLTCKRSPYSFVFEVGRQLQRPHAPYACSGATVSDLPGQLDQTFAQGVPAVISITIGANDIGWSNAVSECYTANCATDSQLTAGINTKLANLQNGLLSVMKQIRDRSGGTVPRIVVTGYYNPVSTRCTTASGGRVTADEVQWATGAVTALNTTLQNVVNYTNTYYGNTARFAPVDFTGHDLCSTAPWIQGLSDAAPVHPNAAGQQAIARSVVTAAR